ALPADAKGGSAQDPVSTHLLKPDTHGQLSYTGLIFSRDGRRIYLSNVDGSVKVFSVEEGVVRPLRSYSLPASGNQKRAEEIPAGLALSQDGRKLYVALNLSNR